ncbi:MAG: triose-phosphate isomerase [Chloroflexi bacterium]|nr:triose-phosphate isomerase [Chloroflexota bacterium]
MRTPIIAGNWKMNTTVPVAVALVDSMRDRLEQTAGAEKIVCPPFVSLAAVRDLLAGTSVEIGAQNMYFEDKGAFTGEVSPAMLAPLCKYVILGHSERRQYFAETDEIVNKKILAALKHGLLPIVCVGENLAQNEAGQTADVVTRQIRTAFAGVPSLANVVVAYEPIWAIGTGKPATGPGANQVIGLIRSTLEELYGRGAAQAVRIQYGGSVTAANIAEFISQPEIDGALVGGASLKADEFVRIVAASAEAKR